MKTVRLTMAQALVRFLENQYIEVDGVQNRFVRGVFIIPGHGNVVGFGQALTQEAKHLEVWHGQNEQGMAQAAVAFAKQMKRKQICVATSSVGPGAANMVTACGTATANNIPLLVLPGDTYACRQPDPVLQQVEQTHNLSITTNDAFKAVCRYWDRIVRPEQLMSAMLSAFRVLTDPANTGAVCIAMPQDVEGEAYDYPESFFKKRVWRLERRPATEAALADAAEAIKKAKRPLPQDVEGEAYDYPESFFKKRVWRLERRPATEAALADAAEAIKKAKRPLLICGGGVRYSEAHEEFRAFAEATGIPFAETQAGKSAIEWTHPLNLGGLGVTGCSAANDIAKKADLVIGVGTRYTDFTTASKWLFKDTCKFVNINVSEFQALKLDAVPVVTDAKDALPRLLSKLDGYKAPYTTEVSAAPRRHRPHRHRRLRRHRPRRRPGHRRRHPLHRLHHRLQVAVQGHLQVREHQRLRVPGPEAGRHPRGGRRQGYAAPPALQAGWLQGSLHHRGVRSPRKVGQGAGSSGQHGL